MSAAVGVSRSRSRSRKIGPIAFVALFIGFLFVPIVIVVAFSFNSSARLSFPFAGLSLTWYQQALGDPLVDQALVRSAIAGAATAVISVLLGVTAALGLHGLKAFWRSVAMVAVLVPLAIPGLLFAIGLAVFYHQLSIHQALQAAVAGHVVIALPFVILTMNAALDRFRFSMLEAARDLGATRAQAFWSVTVPIVRPAIEGSLLLAAAISVDEFVISFFVAGRDITLPVLIYGRVTHGIDPSLNALASILLLASTILSLLAARRGSVQL